MLKCEKTEMSLISLIMTNKLWENNVLPLITSLMICFDTRKISLQYFNPQYNKSRWTVKPWSFLVFFKKILHLIHIPISFVSTKHL